MWAWFFAGVALMVLVDVGIWAALRWLPGQREVAVAGIHGREFDSLIALRRFYSRGTSFLGGASHYAEFEADGTMELHGDATVWDDLRVPLEKGRLGGGNDPAFEQVKTDGAGSAGVYAYNFDDGEEIYFSVQLPHSWKLGSTIYPHFHWMAEGDASGKNVGLGLEYTWCDIGETMGNTTIATRDVAGGTALLHRIHNVPEAGIAGTGHTLSSVLLCRVFRQAAAADNYTGGIFIMERDFHFELDTIGSRGVVTK